MWILIPLALFGLLIGSFIGAVSYRLPKNLRFIKGRSFCDTRKKDLRWFDNIPAFSYLVLGGKSSCCGKKISIRYPLIEIASGIGTVLIFFWSQNLIFCLLFFILLTIFVIDLENQIIPDELSFLVLLSGILYSFSFEKIFVGFFLSFLILLLYLLTKGKGMGLGDVKLTIGLGVWLNFSKGFTFLLLSFLTGGVIAFILLLIGKAKLKTKLAFGPFLIIGFLITLLFL